MGAVILACSAESSVNELWRYQQQLLYYRCPATLLL